MRHRIVIMGGSFNPPTIAHLELMRSAINAVDARLGIFLPAGYDYVAKKMKRQKCPQDILCDAIRLEMLVSMCKGDARLTVSAIRMNRPELSYDYETLQALQEEYTEDELYSVTGSDKLYVLPRWHRAEELINDFRILVAKRGNDDLEQIKEMCPFIAEHWDRFDVFAIPKRISQISSSAFREKLHSADMTVAELVTDEVWHIMERNGIIDGTK